MCRTTPGWSSAPTPKRTAPPWACGPAISSTAPTASATRWTTTRSSPAAPADSPSTRRSADRLGDDDGVEVLNDVVLNQVLVRLHAADGDHDGHTRRMVQQLQREGICWMSGTTWRGQTAMRISVSNWSTDEADVDRSVEAILRCVRAATGSPRGHELPASAA